MKRIFILEVEIEDNCTTDIPDRPITFNVLYDKDIWASINSKKEVHAIPYTSQEEYEKCYDFLQCLFTAGVDNWSGFGEAVEIAKEEYDIDW